MNPEQAWYYDTRSEEGLCDEVFAPKLRVDYSKLLGGKPFDTDGPSWAAQAMKLVERFDSSQHLYGCAQPHDLFRRRDHEVHRR